MKRAGVLMAATAALLLALPSAVRAHEVRPAYLELREIAPATYDVTFRVPARRGRALALDVALPAACRSDARTTRVARGAALSRWRATCEEPLAGARIHIPGLEATRTDVLARLVPLSGAPQTVRLTPDAPGFQVAARARPLDVIRAYATLGIEHIAGGIDHLLFVVVLGLLAGGARRLVGAITAFTAAHSITLAAATLGWLRVPQAPVEAAIALSIVLVAAEVLAAARGGGGLALRSPWIAAFAFGLLHGLGFAGALREAGLPADAVPLALLAFNAGVELGQLAFVAAALGLLALAARSLRVAGRADHPAPIWALAARTAKPAAYAIGTLAAFWLIERTARFWEA